MVQILILADNNYSDTNYTFLRGTGAHKIATTLRVNGYTTEVVDYILRWSLEDFQQLCEKLVTVDTLMLGISSNLFTDSDNFNKKISWFKSRYPEIPIVLGGNNLLARDIQPVDYLIEGYAESALLHLLQYFSGCIDKNQIKWSKLLSTQTLINATIDYPHNDTENLTIRYQDSDFIRNHETLGIETARGCIFKCKFCTYPLIGKKKTDFLRDHRNIRDELLYNFETHGVTNYMIAEDTFNDSIDKLENLAEAIRGLSFRPQFASYIRFDLAWAKPHTLNLLREIGLRAAYFGIETFNDNDGKLVGKGTRSEKIKDGLLWWAQEAKDIATHVGMIMGLPNATEEQAWKDHEWLSTSGINWWSWNALYFTDTTKTIHTSDFSHNYQQYGYELMSDIEIQRVIDEEQRKTNDPSYQLFHYNTKSYRQKMSYWKHSGNGMNFFTAADLSNRLNATSRTRRLGGFHVLTHSSLGFSIDDVMQWGYYDVKPGVPEQEIKQRTSEFIQEYTNLKLNYQYNYHKPLTKISKFNLPIPIQQI
jgi:phage gp46-like protein